MQILSIPNLIETKQYQIFAAQNGISKIKHAQRLRIVDVYQIKKQIYLHTS